MSVEHYICCHDCKKILHIGSDGLSGFRFFSGETRCMKALRDFVQEHVFKPEHRIAFCSEQGTEDETYEHINWDYNEAPR